MGNPPADDHTTDQRLQAIEARMLEVETSVRDSSTKVDPMAADVKELLSLFQAAKGGLKVMGWFGVAAKWVAGVAAAVAAIYAMVQNFRGH